MGEGFLLAALFLAFLIVGLTTRRGHHIRRLFEPHDEEDLGAFLTRATEASSEHGTYTGTHDGVSLHLEVASRDDTPMLDVRIPLKRQLRDMHLTLRHATDTATATTTSFLTGDDAFDPRFFVRGDPLEALVTLTRDTRQRLLDTLSRLRGEHVQRFDIDKGTLRATLRAASPDRLRDALTSLADLATNIDRPARTERFTRLVSEAAKTQAPGYRRRCLDALREHYSDKLKRLRSHPDAGVRFVCMESHPERFPSAKRAALLREVALNHEVPEIRGRALRRLARTLSRQDLLDDTWVLPVRLSALEHILANGSDSEDLSATILKMIEEALPRERLAMLRSLLKLDGPHLPQVVAAWADFEDIGPVDAEALLEALPHLNRRDSHALMETLLHADSLLVQRASVEALRRRGGAQTLALLRRTRPCRPNTPQADYLDRLNHEAIAAIEERLAHP